eukprot:Colp12_sorted_trinity150504_noHs@888
MRIRMLRFSGLVCVLLLVVLVLEAQGGTVLKNATKSPKTPLAIVMPFVAIQARKIKLNLETWNHYNPCNLSNSTGAKVDFIFQYDADIDKNMEDDGGYDGPATREQLMYVYDHLDEKVKACFSKESPIFMSSKLPIGTRHPSGPCLMFFHLMEALSRTHDHVFIMEPDMLVIRENWLDALVRVLNPKSCDNFWQLGSNSLCDSFYGDNGPRLDYHINGNALFCLADGGLLEYIDRVREFYPPSSGVTASGCTTGKMYEGGHDHTMYRFRLVPENFDYVKNILYKFQYSQVLLNFCEIEYDIEEVRAQWVHSYFVHSKAPFMPRETVALRHVVREVFPVNFNDATFGMYAHLVFNEKLTRRVWTNELGTSELAAHFCYDPVFERECLIAMHMHTHAPSQRHKHTKGHQ